MKKGISIFIFLLLLCCGEIDAQIPMVFSIDGKALKENKDRIKANDAVILPAYKKLIKDADLALNFLPRITHQAATSMIT